MLQDLLETVVSILFFSACNYFIYIIKTQIIINEKVKHLRENGSSAIKAVNVLRDAGYVVNRVIAIVDRMEDHKVWKNNDIEFISLYKLEDIAE